jgi:hypothetical protein
MSSKAKVLIQPRLYVNQVPSVLSLLSDSSVTVTTTNESDIPSTMNFDTIKLSHSEEIEIEFPINAKVKFVDIEVTAKLDKLHSKQDTL